MRVGDMVYYWEYGNVNGGLRAHAAMVVAVHDNGTLNLLSWSPSGREMVAFSAKRSDSPTLFHWTERG